jgi:hypothetical protein
MFSNNEFSIIEFDCYLRERTVPMQYDDSYAKEQYYADSCRSDSAEHNKKQRKCKKCGNPMKGHKRSQCEQVDGN